jgi:hypothetical protein
LRVKKILTLCTDRTLNQSMAQVLRSARHISRNSNVKFFPNFHHCNHIITPLPLSWTKLIQTTPLKPYSITVNTILPPTSRSAKHSLPNSLSTHVVYISTFLKSLIRPACLSLFYFFALIQWKSKNYEDIHCVLFPILRLLSLIYECSQFIKPTKCTLLFPYECYIYRSDMFRCQNTIFREHVLPSWSDICNIHIWIVVYIYLVY